MYPRITNASDNNYAFTTKGNVYDILYITLEKSIITKKRAQNQIKTNFAYEINIEGISAVYYIGKNVNDKLLVWKR
jgi:hypothetical protein